MHGEGLCIHRPEHLVQLLLLLSSHPCQMAAARLETAVMDWLGATGFSFSAVHPEICSPKEHTGERALPWTVGEPEGESSLKGCEQLKETLEGSLEVSWARLFLFYFSFVPVTIRVNFSQAFS